MSAPNRRPLVLAMVLAFLLAACGGGEEEAPPAPDGGGGDPAAEGAGEGGSAGTAEEPTGETPRTPPGVDPEPYLTRARDAHEAAEKASDQAERMRLRVTEWRALSEAILAGVPDRTVEGILPKLRLLRDQVLDWDAPVEGMTVAYEVQSGDTLWDLCREEKGKLWQKGAHCADGYLLWLNGLRDASRLRAGATLLVPVGEFQLLVQKDEYRLLVFFGGGFVEEFRVGLGKDDKTPEGSFTILTKLEEPTYTSPQNEVIPFGDPRNPLGTRWLGFKNTRRAFGYGIHGTDEPASIGEDSSNGCVRMLNEEVERLASWVPRGTVVSIRR
jgi:hypothetical protein